MRGGYRENAGRKTGYSAIEAEKAREFIVAKVSEALEPIVTTLINRAREGDIRAAQILFDRAFGKPLIPIETVGEAPMMIMLDM
jgi:hypothetical protein